MARKIEDYNDIYGVKNIRIFTEKRGTKCISRDRIIEIMNDLTCEKKGRRSEHYHGVYAIYPTEDSGTSERWREENIGKKCGVKRIFEKFFGDDNFSTWQATNWLYHLNIAVDDDSTIAVPRRTPRITRKKRNDNPR